MLHLSVPKHKGAVLNSFLAIIKSSGFQLDNSEEIIVSKTSSQEANLFTQAIDKQFKIEFDIDLSSEGSADASVKIFDFPEMYLEDRQLKICANACTKSPAITSGNWTNIKVFQDITALGEYAFQVHVDDIPLKIYEYLDGRTETDMEARVRNWWLA